MNAKHKQIHGTKLVANESGRLLVTSAPLQSCRLASATLLALLLFAPHAAIAQDNDPAEACEAAVKLMREDNDLEGALDEARWCVESLEQIKEQQALSVFPDQVGGFVGGATNSQKTFGISMIERSYVSGSQTIKVSLAGGGPAGAGLAALAKFAMQLGVQGGEKMRIQRRTVMDIGEGNEVAFLVQLRSGSALNVTSETTDRETVVAFLKEFPIAELDDALKE